jgi:hypothetical protein
MSNTNTNTTPTPNSNLNTPVLYVEESIKATRSGVTTKYDTDWRIYIIYRYGKYLFCGTRQPCYETTKPHKRRDARTVRNEKKKHKYNDAASWPVISMSFNYPSEVYSFMTSLFGTSKVNLTLYISPKPIVDMDTIFADPSHTNLRVMDSERQNRKMELVGYDRAYVEPFFFNDNQQNINLLKQLLLNLDVMGSGSSGMGLSFTCNVNAKDDEATKYADEQCYELNELNEPNELNATSNDADNYEYNYDDSDYTYDVE